MKTTDMMKAFYRSECNVNSNKNAILPHLASMFVTSQINCIHRICNFFASVLSMIEYIPLILLFTIVGKILIPVCLRGQGLLKLSFPRKATFLSRPISNLATVTDYKRATGRAGFFPPALHV